MSERTIEVEGRDTPRNGVPKIFAWNPEGDLLGTVIFVHGLFDDAESAWNGTLGKHTDVKAYKRPHGKPLKQQFEESGVKALFLVPEAEINKVSFAEVVWRSLPDLLSTAGAKGPVVALSHSGGYSTVYFWLDQKELVHISLIDSMYGNPGNSIESKYASWLRKEGHTIDLVGATPPPRSHFAEMVKAWPNDKVEDRTPPVLKNGSGPDPLSAKVLWMKDPYNHMDLIAEGKVIPALLKRAEAALLRASNKAPPQPASKPAPKLFEAGWGDDETQHAVEPALRSELKGVRDLAQMAVLHDLVLKTGITRPEAVKAIQKALNKVMGSKLSPSGNYDGDTEKAVRDFQTRWNSHGNDPRLGLDGRVGAHTLLALDHALIDPSSAAGAAPAPAPAPTPAPAPVAPDATNHAPSAAGHYPLDITGAERIATKYGNIFRFKNIKVVTNQKQRPKFFHPKGIMVEYTGPGSDPGAAGSTRYGKDHRLIHPVLVKPLTRLMTALIEEGERIDDESMKRATIGSAWRSWEQDGVGFLSQLRKRIRLNPKIFGDLQFPADLEEEAQSNLYGKEQDFINHLAAHDPWNQKLAAHLYTLATNFKGPGGLSPHESGLVVDIDFPYGMRDKHENVVARFHQITTDYNEDARLSGAGKWLVDYATAEFHFSSYNTAAEIWHMEWLAWKNSEADPDHKKS